MLITLGGKAGSGKGTIAKLLSEQLQYEVVSVGDMRRKLAEEMGLNIYDFNILGDKPENAKEFDLKYEEMQKVLSLADDIILDSRLGFYCQPKAFKILLDVEEEVASKRILGAKRETDQFESDEEALKEVKERNLNDAERYKKLYDIDVWDVKNYSLVIDTSERTPQEILEIILTEFKVWKLKKGIGNTEGEKKAISKAQHKKSLLKNILLLLALLVIAGIWIGTVISQNRDLAIQQKIAENNETAI